MTKPDYSTIFIAVLVILATPFALGSFMLSSVGHEILKEMDPQESGYAAPRNTGTLIENSQNSTVMVECKNDESSLGSGWAIELENENTLKKATYTTSIVTAHHVIENCLDTRRVSIYLHGEEKSYIGIIEKIDQDNDLALITTTAKIKPFELSRWAPLEGYWVMTMGAPEAFEGSVTIGYIMNYTDSELFYTAPVSGGNSGGPLIDNEGRVVGTVTASAIDSDFNIATSLDSMCKKFIKCEGQYFWPWN
jgi:S1-C subfamily serine protease